MKAENPQLNVSDVRFDRGKGGKNLFGKRGSSRISNVSNSAVDYHFFEKHEYHALTTEQKNTAPQAAKMWTCLKCPWWRWQWKRQWQWQIPHSQITQS
jgi:hypothetical protein